jgi:hypothetical protein
VSADLFSLDRPGRIVGLRLDRFSRRKQEEQRGNEPGASARADHVIRP